jgi:hypothetical protein
MARVGFVTATRLSCDPSQDGRRLRRHRRGVPLLHRLGSDEAQHAAGDQMALSVERVADGGMPGEEAQREPADLNRCIFRSRRRTG